MKKITPFVFVLLIILSACDSLKPGIGKIKEGKITYKIDLGQTEMPFMQKQLFEASTLAISFKDEFVKTDFDMGMMGGTTVIADGKTKAGLMLISMMGNKTAARMNAEDFKEKNKADYTIEYLDETKVIAGYTCKKAVVKLANGGTFTMFYTEDIMPANRNTSFTYGDTKGFPLEMQVNMLGMIFNMVATSVDGNPQPAEDFSLLIPEGYTETDLSHLPGGMGGEGGTN